MNVNAPCFIPSSHGFVLPATAPTNLDLNFWIPENYASMERVAGIPYFDFPASVPSFATGGADNIWAPTGDDDFVYLPLGSDMAFCNGPPVNQWTPVWSSLFKAAEVDTKRRQQEQRQQEYIVSSAAKFEYPVPKRVANVNVSVLEQKAEQIILADRRGDGSGSKCGSLSSSSLTPRRQKMEEEQQLLLLPGHRRRHF